MADDLTPVLKYLLEKHGVDLSGYRLSMLERQLLHRFSEANCATAAEYLSYLRDNPTELGHLLDAFTIHVSRFFRDALTFEYIAESILPVMIQRKRAVADPSLRIWSAGCAMGEEPYSVSMLIHEISEKDPFHMEVHIFATDIGEKILAKAAVGQYPVESVEGVKYGLLKKYFIATEDAFQLIQKIRESVSFSVYNILDRKTVAPSESVFGSFDLVFCRNLLIYFDTEHQERIFNKLYRCLSPKGYLVLGSAEIPPVTYQAKLTRMMAGCHVYQKL